MKIKVGSIFLLLGILVSSCASVNEFTISVEKPARVTFPNPVQRVIIANNTIDQPEEINHKSYKFSKEIGDIKISAEGLGDVLVETLADNLDQSALFDSVFIDTNLSKEGLSFLEIRDLNREQAKTILDENNGDLLITLDRYVAMLSSDMANIGEGAVSNFYEVRAYMDFSIYGRSGEKQKIPIIYRDTLYWREYVEGRYLLSDPLPSFEDALTSTAIYVANSVAQSLLPQWKEVRRWIYSDATTEMRRAKINLDSKKWEEARDIWTARYEKETNLVKKSRLASNISLSYELMDDLPSAHDWIEDAEKLLLTAGKRIESQDEDIQRVVFYKEQLETRILDFKLLDLQDQR